MPNYKNGKIYRLVSNKTEDVYYGSTTAPLSQRLAEHKYNYNHPKRGQCCSKFIVKFDDVKIVLVEDYPCDRREQLDAREYHYIETNACINKREDLGRLGGEHVRNDNDRRNASKPFTCECGSIVRADYKKKHKQTKRHLAYVESQNDDESDEEED
eukprot:Lithocolla_globosa_v1_NODE_1952_length_2243_cov_366.873400.p2 type:complete len:156 gc:universal NODE_1952_length_2243_cov_366.873400:824-1291(+)